MLTYFQSVVIGLLQGFSELFPISSLGHAVLLPSLLGWDSLVRAQSRPESFFLAFLVGLHVATAIALLVYFRSEWVRIIGGFFRSIGRRRIETADERLAWLIVVATIPAGLTGVIGVAQVFALFAGISRSGITMVAGLLRGLSHEDAARFSFLLATPIILAAGVYKLPDLFGPLGHGIRMQVLVGSICAGLMAYVSVAFLMRYFETRTLTPFAVYCFAAGIGMSIYLAVT